MAEAPAPSFPNAQLRTPVADLLSPRKAPAATSKAAVTHQQTDRFWGCPGCPFDLFYSPEHSLSTRLPSAPCSISQHKKIPLVRGVTSQSKFKLFCPVPLASHYDQCLGTTFPQLFGFFGQTHSFLQTGQPCAEVSHQGGSLPFACAGLMVLPTPT